ncbi:PRC-barrel domain-containing protein [Lacisediminimonas sp.]|uniref:PRC-barrel domain-containing protein n=1 Tax=Lacisediminimonas sp. TaxID=3060582 RepID=UPI0027179AD5|nr:PRC-barrel domain-containing protein [Lacisediminimonas sp.]MDO8301322.1 PRC-barrel domain-containing protein [Lacisediminimonas sp.]MDO9219026.1 PRC-barrel domain-containing protein [Lacisediminimonas sp.]
MLRSLKALDGFKIAATDGELGRVKDIYFDDQNWTVRYFEVDTGGWLSGRIVLLSPASVTGIDWKEKSLRVQLTRRQLEDSPGLDSALPVSRQHELALSHYYGYPHYWNGPFIWGYTAFPMLIDPIPYDPATDQLASQPMDEQPAEGDPHLRTKDEVIGYQIEASDDVVGHVDDFLFDERDWSIRLMVVDTGDWLPGRHVLISPALIRTLSWEEKSVRVRATRSEIESSTEYDSEHPPEGAAQIFQSTPR